VFEELAEGVAGEERFDCFVTFFEVLESAFLEEHVPILPGIGEVPVEAGTVERALRMEQR
jgi:hypothetical protein